MFQLMRWQLPIVRQSGGWRFQFVPAETAQGEAAMYPGSRRTNHVVGDMLLHDAEHRQATAAPTAIRHYPLTDTADARVTLGRLWTVSEGHRQAPFTPLM